MISIPPHFHHPSFSLALLLFLLYSVCGMVMSDLSSLSFGFWICPFHVLCYLSLFQDELSKSYSLALSESFSMLVLFLLSSFSIPEEAGLQCIAHHFPLIPNTSLCDNSVSRGSHRASDVTTARSKPITSASSLNFFLPSALLHLLPVRPVRHNYPRILHSFPWIESVICKYAVARYSSLLPLINILNIGLNMKPWGVLLVNALYLSQMISVRSYDAFWSSLMFVLLLCFIDNRRMTFLLIFY